MKKRLLALVFLSACQSISLDGDQDKPRSWLLLKGDQISLDADAGLLKGSQELDPILSAAQGLQWDRVLILSQGHLQKFPGNKDALLLLSLAYAGQGEASRSRFFAEMVLKGHPGNAFALNILGMLKRNSAVLPEDHRQALVYFQLAQQAAPQSPIGALNSGYLNLEIGQFREARSDFKLAQSKCEDCTEARLGSALSNQALGLFDEAKTDIEAVLARDEHNPTAQLLMASQSLYLRHEYDESRKILTALLDNVESGSEMHKEVRALMNRMETLAH